MYNAIDIMTGLRVSMALYIVLAKLARHMKPTGTPVDDVTALMIANEGNVMGGVILTGVLALLTAVINEKMF